MHAELAGLNHCAVPFLSRAVTNLYWHCYNVYVRHKTFSLAYLVLTEGKNEVK